MMGAWVITVCGIAILSVLCDVILPEGQTRKYIKTVVGIAVTFVIVQPLLSFVIPSDNGTLNSTDKVIEVQQSFLDDVKRRQNENISKQAYTLLSDNGIDVAYVDVTDDSMEIEFTVKYSAEYEKKAQEILSKNFPNKIIIINWKEQNEKN